MQQLNNYYTPNDTIVRMREAEEKAINKENNKFKLPKFELPKFDNLKKFKNQILIGFSVIVVSTLIYYYYPTETNDFEDAKYENIYDPNDNDPYSGDHGETVQGNDDVMENLDDFSFASALTLRNDTKNVNFLQGLTFNSDNRFEEFVENCKNNFTTDCKNVLAIAQCIVSETKSIKNKRYNQSVIPLEMVMVAITIKNRFHKNYPVSKKQKRLVKKYGKNYYNIILDRKQFSAFNSKKGRKKYLNLSLFKSSYNDNIVIDRDWWIAKVVAFNVYMTNIPDEIGVNNIEYYYSPQSMIPRNRIPSWNFKNLNWINNCHNTAKFNLPRLSRKVNNSRCVEGINSVIPKRFLYFETKQ